MITDAVATFGETTGYYALRQMYAEMLKNPEGQRIIRDQPRIHSTTIDLEALGQLPPNTFGYNYYDFLRVNVSFLQIFGFCNSLFLLLKKRKLHQIHENRFDLLMIQNWHMYVNVIVKYMILYIAFFRCPRICWEKFLLNG